MSVALGWESVTVNRPAWGPLSLPPVPGAIRGPEAPAFPGEYVWFIELNGLDDLIRLLDEHGGLVLWSAAEGEGQPVIEIPDEDV